MKNENLCAIEPIADFLGCRLPNPNFHNSTYISLLSQIDRKTDKHVSILKV